MSDNNINNQRISRLLRMLAKCKLKTGENYIQSFF